MDLRKELTNDQSKKKAMEIVLWVGDDQERLDELMEVFLVGHFRLNQRAAWPLGIIGEKQPQLLYKHLEAMTEQLSLDVHDAVKRNVLRTFQFIKIPENMQGKIANACFDFLNDQQQPVAFRAFSMTVLFNIGLEQPELLPEIKLVIQENMLNGTSGIMARGRKIMKAIDKLVPPDSF